ncbi:MAG: hypothetical protein U0263_04855 [Polyangiaceae bacterium]
MKKLTFSLIAFVTLGCSASANTTPDEAAGLGGSGGGNSGAGGSLSLPTAGAGGLGSGGSGSGASTQTEPCNGLDDDGDGQVDEGCSCKPGSTQTCFPYAPEKDGVGMCSRGTQTCEAAGEFGQWGPCDGATGPGPEVCDDGVDEDCDGSDATCGGGGAAGAAGAPGGGGAGSGGAGGGPGSGGTTGGGGGSGGAGITDTICQDINLIGDCLSVSCPAAAPYPKSCNVFFAPGDDRGCVASTPQSSTVYFQAGDQCNVGLIIGKLCCAKTPQAPLDQLNCPITKPIPIHVSDKNQCPQVK